MAGCHAPLTSDGQLGGTRVWASRAGLVAIVVLGVQLLWRAILLHHGYFSQDDFLVMSRVQGHGWSDRLSGTYAGGFAPGASVLAWVCVSVAPLGWGLAASVVLALQTAATAMMWVVLTRLLADRWSRVPLFVLFAVGTLTLWSTQWWVLGLQLWPSVGLLLVAVWAVLRVAQDGAPRAGVVGVAAVATAVLFDERAVLHPVVLLGVVMLVRTELGMRERLVRSIREHLWVWVALLLVVTGYALLRWQVAPIDTRLGDELGTVVTTYLRHGLAEGFGGPWIGDLPAHAYVVPKSWVVALNGALLLGLAGITLQRGGARARVAWAMLVVFVAASVGLLALVGRAELLGSLGLVPRFAAGLAPVLTLALAGAFGAVAAEPVQIGSRRLGAAAVEASVSAIAAGLVVVSAGVSTALLAPNLYHRDDRTYVATLRADLRAHPQVVLLDGRVPDGVISSWYGNLARVSSVVGYAPETPVFDLPSHALRTVADDGHLTTVAVTAGVTAAPSRNVQCGYPVRADGTWVPMAAPVPFGRWVLRIGYYTASDGFATVDVAGQTFRFAVRDGLQAVDLVVVGGFDGFLATIEDHEATLCLTNATAGIPRPVLP